MTQDRPGVVGRVPGKISHLPTRSALCPPPPPLTLAEELHKAPDSTHGTKIHRSPALQAPNYSYSNKELKPPKIHPVLPVLNRNTRPECFPQAQFP